MRITFVYPGIAVIGFNSLATGGHDTISVNMGMGYISAYLKQNSNHKTDLIDLRDLKSWEHFEDELKGRNSDIVGIYTNTVNYLNSMKCAQIAKKLGKTVICGGPHATLVPNELLETSFVDCVITGEGELSFLEVVNKLEKKEPIDRIVVGKKIENLDEIPFPDRDLYNMGKILSGPGIYPYPNRYIGVLGSRGCHYNCSFCQPLEKNIFGKVVRKRSVDNIIAEVKYLIDKYKVNFIMFECDTLTVYKDWTLELCAKMKELNIKWGAQSRVDKFSEDVARALSDAGCMVVFFGFESGSQRILNLLRKGTKPEQAIEASRLCKKYGILIFANIMLGMPTETEDDLKATYDMIKTIKPELFSPSYYSPIPGSDLYNYCKEKDLIKVTSYEGFVRNALNEKIKGVDYSMVGRYKDAMGKETVSWLDNKGYRQQVVDRWKLLIREGYHLRAIKEFIYYTPVINKPFKVVYNMMKKVKTVETAR